MAVENQTPAISVIIACLGHVQELSGCLSSLQKQNTSFVYEIIVVDSAADPGVALAAEKFPAVRLVRSHNGLFPGAARNLGAQHAHAELLGFVDADCTLPQDWIEQAVSTL